MAENAVLGTQFIRIMPDTAAVGAGMDAVERRAHKTADTISGTMSEAADKLGRRFKNATDAAAALDKQIESGSPRMLSGLNRLVASEELLREEMERVRSTGAVLTGEQVASYAKIREKIGEATRQIEHLRDAQAEQRQQTAEGGEQWLGFGNAINKAMGPGQASRMQAFGVTATAALTAGWMAGRQLASVIGTDDNAFNELGEDVKKAGHGIQGAMDNAAGSVANLALSITTLDLAHLKNDAKEFERDIALGALKLLDTYTPIDKSVTNTIRAGYGLIDGDHRRSPVGPPRLTPDQRIDAQARDREAARTKALLNAQLLMEQAQLTGNREAAERYAKTIDSLSLATGDLTFEEQKNVAAQLATGRALQRNAVDRAFQKTILQDRMRIATAMGDVSSMRSLESQIDAISIAEYRAAGATDAMAAALVEWGHRADEGTRIAAAIAAGMRKIHEETSQRFDVLQPSGVVFSGNAEFTKQMAVISRARLQAARSLNQNVVEDARRSAAEEAKIREDAALDSYRKGKITADDYGRLIAESHRTTMETMRAIDLQYGTSWEAMLDRQVRSFGTASQRMETLMASASQNMSSSTEEFFFDVFKGRVHSIDDVFKGFLDSMLHSIAKFLADQATQALLKMIASYYGGRLAGSGTVNGMSQSQMGALIGAHANGGVLAGGFRAFAAGGVVSKPTLGLVGEGKYNEAVIPLPDNKSVPVRLYGGGREGRNDHLSISLEPGLVANLAHAGAEAGYQRTADDLRTGGPMYRLVQRIARQS